MIKCPVCGKQKSAFQMRPIVNIEELRVGAAMSDQPTEQEVAGQKVDVVCRDCWMQILNSRSKEEVIEILETICGVLMEVDNKMKTSPMRRGDFIIEKLNSQSPQPPISISQPAIWQVDQNQPQWESIKPFCAADNWTGKLNLSERFSTWVADIHGGDTGTLSLNIGKDGD